MFNFRFSRTQELALIAAIGLMTSQSAFCQDIPAISQASNPYGLEALWGSSDMVARGVLLLLLVMSVASWFVIASKLLEQSRLLSYGAQASKDFWGADTLSLIHI